MASIEQEGRRRLDIVIRGAEVLTIGLATLGGLVSGYNLIEGDLGQAKNFAEHAGTWSLIAGGIFAAEKLLKKSESKPPEIR